MFLAAGLGTRLRPFTEITAKPLLPVLGVPLSQLAFDGFAEAGVRRVVANVHWLAESTARGLMSLDKREIELKISDESSEILGSAGGPRKALAQLGGAPFVYFNGDMLTDVDLKELSARHEDLSRRFGARITLAIGRPEEAQGQYTEIQIDRTTGAVRGLGAASGAAPFFLGVAMIDPSLFVNLPEGRPLDLVSTVLNPAISRGEAGFFEHRGHWFDIGSPAEWLGTHLKLIEKLENGSLPSHWRNRFEAATESAGKLIRIARGSGIPGRGSRGPAFWQGSEPPAALGPGAVLYEPFPVGLEENLKSGIGYGGRWVAVPPSRS